MITWIALGILIIGGLGLVLSHDAGTIAGMASDDFARIVAAVALLLWIGAGFFGRARFSAFKAIKQAVAWTAVALGLVLAYSYREDFNGIYHRIVTELNPSRPAAVVTASGGDAVQVLRDAAGHFVVRAEINGSSVPMLVDTGASSIVLSTRDAERVRIGVEGLSFIVPVQTANGTGFAARTRIAAIAVGPIVERDIDILVASEGALNQSLLGMNFLNRLTSFSVSGDRLVMVP